MTKGNTSQKPNRKNRKGSERKKREEIQESEIESTPINDEKWNCIVSMLIERRPRYMVHIQQVNEAIYTGLRHVMKCIADDDIIKDVKQLRSAKSGSKISMTTSEHQKLCDEAYHYLSSGDRIPASILARLIKFAILKMKANDISRKEAELILAQEIQEESKLMMEGKTPSFRGTTDTAGGSRVSLKRSLLGKHTAHREKKVTKLRKRGQEWMDIQFIDDAPRQGADLYIVLTGFYDWQLPAELIKLGIPLFGIISMQREDEDGSDVDILDQIEAVRYKLESMMSLDRDSVSLQNELTTRVIEIGSFWKNFRTMEHSSAFIETFKDVAFMKLPPPPDKDLSDDIEKNKDILYTSISYLMYDLHDTVRQHRHYLKNIKVQRYASEGDWNLQRMEVYRSILHDVPYECISVPLISHAIIQEVMYFEDDDKLPMEDFIRRGSMTSEVDQEDVVKASLEKVIEELNVLYGIQEKQIDPVVYQDPLIIIHGDEVLMKTFHCEFPNVDIPEIIYNILKNMIPVKLWEFFPGHDEDFQTTCAHQLFELKNCMKDERISYKTLYSYIYVLIFDNMTCKNTEDVNGPEREAKISLVVQLSSINSKNWNKAGTRPISNISSLVRNMRRRYVHPRYVIKDVDCLNDLSSTCTASVPKMEEKTEYSSDSYRFVEDMSVNVMLQALQVAFQTFTCWDHRYCALTDAMLLRFHHPIDNRGLSEDTYAITIRTPVPLHDFFKYTADEEWEWLASEEDLYQEEQMDNNRFPPTGTDNKEEIQSKYNKSCHCHIPLEDYLITGSIKHDNYLKNLVEGSRHATGTESTLPMRQSDLKGKKIEGMSTKNAHEQETEHNRENVKGFQPKGDKKARKEGVESSDDYGFSEDQDADPKIKQDSYEFEGYDLGKTRFHISGKTTRFYSRDGSKVEVDSCCCLYRWKLLTLKITKSGHTLIFKIYLESPPPNITPISFHAVLKSGIIIAIGKPLLHGCNKNEADTKDEEAPRQVSFQDEIKQIIEHDIILSLPSGLVVETVNEHKFPFYIKQKYLSMGPQCTDILNELYRCYLQSGHVLKFMKNGHVEILTADSSRINCIDANAVAEATITALTTSIPEPPVYLKEDVPSKTDEKKADEGRQKLRSRKPESKGIVPSVIMKKTAKKKSRIPEKIISEHELEEEPELEKLEYEKKFDEDIPEEMPVLEIVDFEAVTADGWEFIVKDGVAKKVRKTLFRTTSDLEQDEIFTRREDYTNTLLQADGSLVVNFADGTRITTKLNICNNIVYCEWTTEEEKILQALMEPEELEVKPMTEGYTLVTVMYLMEHQNYATVAYGQEGLLGELSIPQTNTTIKMLPNGTYEVQLSGNAEMNLGNEIVKFMQFDSSKKNILCSSEVYIRELALDENITADDYEFLELSITRTIDGKIFNVYYDGNTHFRTEDKCPKYNFGYRIPSRWFVLKRDLSGLEIVHEDDVNSLLADIAKHNRAVTVTNIFPYDQELQYHIAMSPVDKDESQKWLTDYRPVKITAKERRMRSHLKRSTYGDPPSWFHPFPKTPPRGDSGKGRIGLASINSEHQDEEEKHDTSNGAVSEVDIPAVMVIRMIREIAPVGVSIMNNLKEGLQCFSKFDNRTVDFNSLYIFGDYDTEFKTYFAGEKVVKKQKVNWQDRTTPAAKELYLLGMRRSLKLTENEICTIKNKDLKHIVNVAVTTSRKSRKESNLQELRYALRNNIVPPYFSSPGGEAFLLVMEALDRAVDNVEKKAI